MKEVKVEIEAESRGLVARRGGRRKDGLRERRMKGKEVPLAVRNPAGKETLFKGY